MPSSYLNKPSRSIKKALKDRGMTARDVGLSDYQLAMYGLGKRTNYRYLAAAFVCLVIALSVVGTSSIFTESRNPDIMTAEEAEMLSSEFENIIPAAGK